MNKLKIDSNYLQKKTHVFLGLIPFPLIKKLKRPFLPLINFFAKLNPNLEKQLDAIDHQYSPSDYVATGFFSYSIFGFILGYLVYILALNNDRPQNVSILLSFATVFLITFILTYFLTKLPSSELKEKGIDSDRYLIYALKEMVIYSRAGSTLYESMVAISEAGYGEISIQFKRVVRDVNTGKPFQDALNELAKRTSSDYFKKVIWQLANTLKTGSDVAQMIQPIIEELDYHQKSQIQNYARELNLWSLVYMIFSAAIPTIGSTMLVVLSVFANFGVDEFFFAMFAIVCVIVQCVLILLVKSRRPNVIF